MNPTKNNALRKSRLIGVGLTARAQQPFARPYLASIEGDANYDFDLAEAKRMRRFLDLFITVCETLEPEQGE